MRLDLSWSVTLNVVSLGGPVCQVAACCDETMWDVKVKVAKAIGTSWIEVRLVTPIGELLDNEQVSTFARSGPGPCDVTLLRRSRQQAQWLHALYAGTRSLRGAPPSIRGDREVVVAALTQGLCGFMDFEHVAPELQADREIAALALQSGYGGRLSELSSLPEAFRSDRELVLLAVERCEQGIRWASEELQNCREVALAAAAARGRAFQFLPEHLRRDEDVALAALRAQCPLELLPPDLRRDKGLVLFSLNVLEHDAYFDDEDLEAAARSNLRTARRHAPELFRDPDFLRQLGPLYRADAVPVSCPAWAELWGDREDVWAFGVEMGTDRSSRQDRRRRARRSGGARARGGRHKVERLRAALS